MGERSNDTARERQKPRVRPAADKAPEKREKPRAPQIKVQEKKKEPIEHNRAIIHKACTPIQELVKRPNKIPPKIAPKAPPKVEPKMQPRSLSNIPPKRVNQVETKKQLGRIMPRQEPKSDAEQKEALRNRKGMFVKIGEEQSKKVEMNDNPTKDSDRHGEKERSDFDFHQMARELDELCKILEEKPVSDATSNNEKVLDKKESESGIKAISKHTHIEPISDIQLDFKKCKNCNKDLPIDRFEKYGGERGKKTGLQSYRSVCQECRRVENRDKKLIKYNVLKLRAVNEVFDGKCIDCGIGLEVLPALEFDHKDPSLKDISWRDMKIQTLPEIKEWKEKENIELRCANCHTERHSIVFEKYKELILDKNLFHLDYNKLDNFLLEGVRKIRMVETREELIKPQNFHKTRNILRIGYFKSGVEDWIRKRYVIESLYGGKCCGCGTDIDNLPALEFHHIDPMLKEKVLKWSDIKNNEDVIKLLLSERCVCVCGNCHAIIGSKFLDSCQTISKTAGISENECAEMKSLAQRRIDNFNDYIDKYQTMLPSLQKKYEEGKFKIPLKRDFEMGENYKKILIKIYHFTEFHGNHFFRGMLSESFGRISFLKEEFHLLLKLGYISTDDNVKTLQKNYYITKEGFAVINDYKSNNREIFDKLKSEVSDIG